MNYRIDKRGLLDNFIIWNGFLKKKIHLIACGGTAMTLLGVKESTKDIDLVVPNEMEYKYLITILKQLGYKSITGSGWVRNNTFIFDLFKGVRVHTTELLESPLKKGNNIFIKEFDRIYLGVLNYYDLIISKLFRGTTIDMEDCLTLITNRKAEIDINNLIMRYRETSSFDICEDKVNKNLEDFLKLLKGKDLYNEKR
ncbi:MAG: hypothetical protein KAJ14_05595 [Candidatus Omnitrophica bacterium]|nr:hypothetical protein [Candidatus Omnitrophota bacterium]